MKVIKKKLEIFVFNLKKTSRNNVIAVFSETFFKPKNIEVKRLKILEECYWGNVTNSNLRINNVEIVENRNIVIIGESFSK